MRGSLKQRSKGSWSIILDLGYEPDPVTGTPKRKQKWHTVRGTRKDAEDKLTDLLKAAKDGSYVDASKLTVAQWLTNWLKTLSNATPATVTRYTGIVDKQIGPSALGKRRLQQVRPSHVEAYYTEQRKTMQSSTLTLHHTILTQAFDKAVLDRLVTFNPVKAVGKQQRPKKQRGKAAETAREHCWTADEARAFLDAAKAAGAQPAAFYGLALDTGMRRGELCGLKWADVDLDAGKVQVVQQLLKPGPSPVFGPPKGKRARTIRIGAEMVNLLKVHRQQQAALKMRNRTTYQDFGLVFAKEWNDVRGRGDQVLGHPLQANNFGQREYAALIKSAGVKRIKFHGLRHTSATLLLASGEAVPVAAQRLGHAQASMTLDVYAHATEDLQHTAATKISALLHAR